MHTNGKLSHVNGNGVALAFTMPLLRFIFSVHTRTPTRIYLLVRESVVVFARLLIFFMLLTHTQANNVRRAMNRLPLPADIRGVIESYVTAASSGPLVDLRKALRQYWHEVNK